MQAELQSILDQVNDRAVYLRLAETLSSFLARLRTSADTLDIQERQRIVRLLVKEVLVGEETIVIRHSIPLSSKPPNDSDPQPPPSGPGAPDDRSYLLRSGRHNTPLRRAFVPLSARLRFHGAFSQRSTLSRIQGSRHACAEPSSRVMIEIVEQAPDVELYNPVIAPSTTSVTAMPSSAEFPGRDP